jgi:hypothetical protein
VNWKRLSYQSFATETYPKPLAFSLGLRVRTHAEWGQCVLNIEQHIDDNQNSDQQRLAATFWAVWSFPTFGQPRHPIEASKFHGGRSRVCTESRPQKVPPAGRSIIVHGCSWIFMEIVGNDLTWLAFFWKEQRSCSNMSALDLGCEHAS